ncbi:MAG TPA: TolC family protein [Capsulimonadaceae bacterium]|nr:TolC family protein [Capsulimonadaceae bacterium]
MMRDHTIAAMNRVLLGLSALFALALWPASVAWSQTGQAGQSAPTGSTSTSTGQNGPGTTGTMGTGQSGNTTGNPGLSGPGSMGNQAAPGAGSGAPTQTKTLNNQPAPGAMNPAQSGTPNNQTNPNQQTTPNQNQPATGTIAPSQPGAMPSSSQPAQGGPGGIENGNAQAGAPTYTLGQTIQAALNASSQLAIANRNLDKDQALIDQAEAGYRPRLDANGSWTFLNKPVKISFAGSPPITVQPVNTENLNAALTLPIDISGQVRAQVQVARLNALFDLDTRDRITNQRVLDAETSYLTLLRSQHQVDVAQASLANAQTQYSTTQKQFAGGIGQRIDVYRAATQVAQAQQDLLSAQNQLALAQNNFNDLIGRPMASPVTVQDVPGVDIGIDIAGGAITPGANPNTLVTPPANLPKLYTPPATVTSISIDRSVQTAMTNRPELLADQVNIEAAHRQIKIAHSGQEPTLSLGATSNYYPTTDFQNPYHSLDVVTATVRIPLYDAGITRDKVREAKDTEANAKDQYSGDKSDVELQVRQAYLNLGTARQQIDAANTALQQAIIARQLAQVRYANGVGLYLEVTDAQSALTTAETNQVNAVYNYLIAQAQFENAIGMPNRNPSL